MKIYYRKPYARIPEGDEASQAIVSYKKIPISFEHHDLGMVSRDVFVGRFQVVPVAWAHRLWIDLYFVILDFKWRSGKKHLV